MEKHVIVPFQQKILFLLLIIGLASKPADAQQDSQPNDVNWYNRFFEEDHRKSIEQDLERRTSQLNDAREKDDFIQQAKTLTEIGLIHLVSAKNYERAIYFFTLSLALEDSFNLQHQQIFSYLAIARIFEEVGDYPKSIQFLDQAMSLNEQSKDIPILVLILNTLGRNTAAKGDLEKAFEYYELALGYKDQFDDSTVEADVLFNLGNLDLLQGKFTESLSHHKTALAIRRKVNDKKKEALSLHTIGLLYQSMKNNDRAMANHQAALEIRQRLNDKKGIAESYINIGVLYYQQKNYSRAMANIELALSAARESQSQAEIEKSYEYLSLCYSSLHEFKKALEYKDQYLNIHDFIQHENSEHQLLETHNRYKLTKQETQINQLELDRLQKEKELQTQKKTQNFLIVILVLSIIISALGVYLYFIKRKSNTILKSVNEEIKEKNIELSNLNATKDKFFSIISHKLA